MNSEQLISGSNLRSDELVSPTPVKPPPNRSGMTTAWGEATAEFWRWFDAKELKEREGRFCSDSGQKIWLRLLSHSKNKLREFEKCVAVLNFNFGPCCEKFWGKTKNKVPP